MGDDLRVRTHFYLGPGPRSQARVGSYWIPRTVGNELPVLFPIQRCTPSAVRHYVRRTDPRRRLRSRLLQPTVRSN